MIVSESQNIYRARDIRNILRARGCSVTISDVIQMGKSDRCKLKMFCLRGQYYFPLDSARIFLKDFYPFKKVVV